MGDAGLQSLFDSLELGFEVGLARDEEEAASDLAVTLRQSQGLREVLARYPAIFQAPGVSPASISLLGHDCVMSEDAGLLAPIAAVHFHVGPAEGDRPRLTPETFVQVLRRWARLRSPVAIQAEAGPVTGRLMACAEDHIEIQAKSGRVLIPLRGVVAVRLCRGGSADAS